LGIGDWAQSPIPNPQSPIPNPQCLSQIFGINKLFLKNKFIKFIDSIRKKNLKKENTYFLIKIYK